MDPTLAAEQNLRWLLKPMQELLADPCLEDLHINGPGEGMCFISRGQGVERLTLPYTQGHSVLITGFQERAADRS